MKGQNVVEHDRCEFEIDVEAADAEVSWYRDGKKINVEDGRVEIVVEGKKRKLVFKDTHLEDAGEITCKTNRDSSSCVLKVACEYESTVFFYNKSSPLNSRYPHAKPILKHSNFCLS